LEKPLSTRRPLGELLMEANVIKEDQLWEALERQKSIGGRIGGILVELGYISESKLKEFLGRQLGIPTLDLLTTEIEKNTVKLIPSETAHKLKVIPIRVESDLGRTVLILATSDPTNIEITDIVSFITGLSVQMVFVPEADIERVIEHYYGIET
jgi:hypothetical protein